MSIRLPYLTTIIIFILVSSTYLILVPPWQGADEPTHFEHIVIMSKIGLFSSSPTFKIDYEAQRQIILSMDEFNFWHYVGVSRPDPVPTTFAASPFLSEIASQRTKSELYYRLMGLILNIIPGQNLLSELYWLRFISLFFSVLALDFMFRTLTILFPKKSSAIYLAFLIVVFLPQLSTLSATVNNDTLFLAFYFAFLYLLLRQEPGQVTLKSLLPVIIMGGFSVLIDRAGIMFVPVLLFHLWQQLPFQRIFHYLKWCFLILLLLMAVIPLMTWWRPELIFKIADNLVLLYLRLPIGKVSMMENQLPFLQFVQVIINSFFCTLGWMRFGLSEILQRVLYLCCGLGFIGFGYRHLKLLFHPSNATRRSRLHNLNTLLFNFVLLFSASVIFFWWRDFLAQGRYLFPSLLVISIILSSGLTEFWSWFGLPQRIAMLGLCILLIMLSFNVILFVLIPAFHY